MNRDFEDTIYQQPDRSVWKGRTDGLDRSFCRWHQVVGFADLKKIHDLENTVVLLGFCCDEGVRRNQGRIGASKAPESIRHILSGLPVHFSETFTLVDAGNIVCADGNLEASQEALSIAVAAILDRKGFPIVLGGGHEVTYGHFSGIRRQREGTVGVINIDAHFDLRKPDQEGPSSGTGFYQISQDLVQDNDEFHYMAIGIQQISNTKALFEYAEKTGVEIVEARDLLLENVENIIEQVNLFAMRVDHVYMTVDLDAFAAPYAPGVSALAFGGIVPDSVFMRLFSAILSLPNIVSMDIAELNPTYDLDNRTAKLAADLIFAAVQKIAAE